MYNVSAVKTGSGRFATDYIVKTLFMNTVTDSDLRRNVINEAIASGILGGGK
jgi:hypothetical protein